MRDWLNQQSRLSALQKHITLALVYEDAGDTDTVAMALGVLNAHLNEDEDEFVRNLVYVVFTVTNLDERRIALSGLLHVTDKNEGIVTATYLYYLNHADVSNKWDALNVSVCISGLSKFSCIAALPKIRELTNAPNTYLSLTAREAVTRLSALQQERK